MKLTVNYEGGKKGFKLEMDLEADIKYDAEALGYITNVLFESAKRLSEFCQNADPKYAPRIGIGIKKSIDEMKVSAEVYPFTKLLLIDE